MGSSRRDYFSGNHSINILNLSLIGVSALFYVINNYFLKEVFTHFFFHWYLNDIFGGLMIVAIANTLILLGKQHKLYMDSLKKILFFTFIVGVYWEYVAPLYLASSVTDPWDIVAYMSGGLIYWIIVRLSN